jgi:hypothetical protein
MKLSRLLGHPTAFAPLVMSSAALLTIAVHIAQAGITAQADEGSAAHVWQLLMAGQLPVVAVFALKWLPAAPRQAVGILALQVGAMVAAAAPVALLGW